MVFVILTVYYIISFYLPAAYICQSKFRWSRQQPHALKARFLPCIRAEKGSRGPELLPDALHVQWI